MTMVPAPEIEQYHQLLVFLQQGGGVLYGGGGYYGLLDHHTTMNPLDGYEYDQAGATMTNCVGSDHNLASSSNPMAADQDESRTNSLNDAVSTSKDENNNNDDSWLTLGLGSHVATVRHDDDAHYSDQPPTTEHRHRRELIELDLLRAGIGTSRAPPPPPPQPQLPLGSILHMPEFRAPSSRPVLHSFGNSSNNNLFFQHQLQLQGSSSTASFPHHHLHHHHHDVGWSTFRPVKDKHVAAVGSPSPSSSSFPFGSSYFGRPFPVQDVAGPPSSDFRVVDPPRRPHSGIWFLLQAKQNQ